MTRNTRSEGELARKLADHTGSPFFQAEASEILRVAGPVSDAWLLDVGCGSGGLIATARSEGVRFLGADISRDVLMAARTLSEFDGFLQAAAERIPFRSQSLDMIFVQHVIEHLRDPMETCREWNRALRSGGRLIVVTPNARYPDPSIYHDPTHIRIFDRSTMRALLETTGYHVDRVETIFPFLRGHIVFGLRHRRLFSVLPPWSRSGRSLVAFARKRESGASPRMIGAHP